MNILIIGCGKVGSGLANSLYKKGHDVSVIDLNAESFSKLDNDFSGYAVEGIPVDVDILKKGGIEATEFLICVTPDDNTNIMVSQIGRHMFNVERVLTRIHDEKRKRLYEQYGFHTVSPAMLTVDIIEDIISGQRYGDEDRCIPFGSASIVLDKLPVPKNYYGVELGNIRHDDNETIVGVILSNGSVIMRDRNVKYRLERGDSIIYAKLI